MMHSRPSIIRLLSWLGCLVTNMASTANAHQDPRGDIHPQVGIVDGKFAILFSNSPPNRDFDATEVDSLHRMIFTHEGKLFAPRHSVKRKRSHEDFGPVGLYGREYRVGGSTFIFQGSQNSYLLKSPEGKIMRVALPWPKGVKPELLDQVCVTQKGIAMTGNNMNPETGESGPLKFFWFEHESTSGPTTFDIGPTASIYQFPVASNIVFAGEKFWVAYMRHTNDNEMKLTLWSWKPGDQKGKAEDLDSPADWNSTLSMAATGDHLCLAYHCVANHEYPGTARIMTVFRKAE